LTTHFFRLMPRFQQLFEQLFYARITGHRASRSLFGQVIAL
jgi:hypothetical protein